MKPLGDPVSGGGFDIVRELGLALPRAEETRYYGMPALQVDGEVFVVQTSHRSAAPNSISVPVGFKRRDQLIGENPRVFYLKPHYQPYPCRSRSSRRDRPRCIR